ncbi:TVP38/TMEM64 family protein [Candidatus Omnitrophota bacterium]
MRASSRRLLVLILFLVMVAVGSRYLRIDFDVVKVFLQRFSIGQAIGVYALIYVLGTIFIPPSKDILKVVGAVCLGAVSSSAGIWIAEVINACLLFYLARSLGRGFFQERLSGRAKLFDQRLGASGFKGILILRLVPLLPYRVMDLLAGLSSFGFTQYFIIAVIGSPLRIFWVQYVLAGVGEAIFKNPFALVDYIMTNRLIFAWSLAYFILVVMVAFRLKFKQRI